MAKVLILYPLKTVENQWFYDVFWGRGGGYKMGTLARNKLYETFIYVVKASEEKTPS